MSHVEKNYILLGEGPQLQGFRFLGKELVPFLHHREVNNQGPNYKFFLTTFDNSGKPSLSERWYFDPDFVDQTSVGILRVGNLSYQATFLPLAATRSTDDPNLSQTHSEVVISPLGAISPDFIPTEPKEGEVHLTIIITTTYDNSASPDKAIREQVIKITNQGDDKFLNNLIKYLAGIE